MNIDPNVVLLVSGVVSLLTIVVLLVVVSKLAKLSKSLEAVANGTGMTAKEMSKDLGAAIESSFQKFMPQPDKVSGAITSAVDAAMKTALSSVDGVQKKLQENQSALMDKWTNHEKSSAATLEGTRKAFEATATQLSTGLAGGSQKLESSLGDGAKKLAEALAAAATQMGGGLTTGSQKLQTSFDDGSKKLTDALSGVSSKLDAALKDHADKTAKASQDLSAQLEKIASLEKDIAKLLHLQQATEGTIKSVTASEEFKQLVVALRTHLESSDKVLKELTKPRTIRLVEEE